MAKSEKWYAAIKKANTKHGCADKERLYVIWLRMRQRCNNPTDQKYSDYGGRGISVCREWNEDYGAFKAWALANGYDDSLTIDREDNDGNYCPENCRWATRRQQANNRRTNHHLTLNGETKTLSEWEDATGINSLTILRRVRQGWSVTDALTTPVRRHKPYGSKRVPG